MTTFNTSNFERIGNTKNDIKLNSTEDAINSILAISSSALRCIKIYTPDLEPQLYNNDDFRKILLNFSRDNRNSQIQILANDTESALHNDHHLVRLSQQVTSSIQIRNTPEEFQLINASFILIDHSAFIYKPDTRKPYSIKSTCKHRTDKLFNFFMHVWDFSKQDPQTRTLNI